MPLNFGPNYVEGKVYRSRRNRADNDGEKQALKELQSILANKSRKACDCEAQVHDLLENCLSCGRFTCVAEGPGKCMSCGSIVLREDQRLRLEKHVDLLTPKINVGSKRQATADRPVSRIVDSQLDYFEIDNKKHLKEEDKRALRDNLEEIQAMRNERQLILDVDIDQLEAGSRSTTQIDDFEATLRRLQLDHESMRNDTKPSFTLAKVISDESKTEYNLEYIETSEPKKKRSDSSGKKDLQQKRTKSRPKEDRKPKSSMKDKNKPQKAPK